MQKQQHIITRLLLSWVWGWVFLAPVAWAESVIPLASDFNALQQQMRHQSLPLLLAFRADYCGFCRKLETEHLEPMVRDGQYATRILIRRFDVGSDQTLTDFNGNKISAEAFAERYQASLTPTLLFLDAEGKEVAERLLGYNSPDFYGAYLEQAISTAQQAVKK